MSGVASRGLGVLRGLAGALLLATPLTSCRSTGPAATLQDGISAYTSNRVAEAEAIFRQVADDDESSVHDRATALRAIARIEWLIDGKDQQALQTLERAWALGERCDAARLRARVLDEAGRAKELVAQTSALLAQCSDSQARDEVHYRVADVLLSAADPSNSRDPLLARANDELSGISPDNRNDLNIAKAELELAVMQGDQNKAIEAWRDYFWLDRGEGPQAFTQDAPAPSVRLARALAKDASLHDQLLLIDLLTRSGFSRLAERVAGRWHLASRAPTDPLWRKAAAYLLERRKLEAVLLASNRRVARGGRAADLTGAMRAMEGSLAAAAGLKGGDRAGLAKTYGLYGTVGKTGGFESIHLGHILQSGRAPVGQYGRYAEVKYLVLDNMISNGYESWLWDGDAMDGGWTEAGPVIVQARPGYASTPLNAWSLVADPDHRLEYVRRLPRLEAIDRSALRSADVAFLPGLAHRLNLQVADQVLARVRNRSGDRAGLHRAFLAEYARANLQQSIFIHEGRHVLDLGVVPAAREGGSAELEYRAKLSELALSDYPRMALFNIDAATIGSGNEHGRANARIMREYGRWIEAHTAEVKGYNRASSPLNQLDRLTDDQIRAVARALDPFAARTRP